MTEICYITYNVLYYIISALRLGAIFSLSARPCLHHIILIQRAKISMAKSVSVKFRVSTSVPLM